MRSAFPPFSQPFRMLKGDAAFSKQAWLSHQLEQQQQQNVTDWG